ncbi:hypothetical protein PGTUg99_020140 [Puccinia graminis f. sp. tritici]|uniref:Uncharacterized protein n=1 Tax=Puccinia graminis f. sp. tritici TaxID=56615 RepID=A0A5B0RUJ8_PUCGR|nr:hypothetical protein PGTUg99_020140 [Puccinia graminis f. sp. tritici]
MSIADEMVVLRKQLAQLQSKLKALESRLEKEVSARIATIKDNSIINDVHSTSPPYPLVKSSSIQKSTRSAQSRDQRTLRSRSFKVMRHLINIVDVSRAASTASELEKKRTTIDSSHDPITSVSSVTELKSSAKPTEATNSPPTKLKASAKTTLGLSLKEKAVRSSNRNDFQASTILLPPITEPGAPVNPKSAKTPPIPPNNLVTALNTSSETPRLFHPKRTRKADLASSNKEANERNLQAVSELPVTKELNTNAHSKLEGAVPKTSETLAITRTSGNKKAEIIEHNDLRRGCSRFALLKYDPAVLDLLPTSVKEKQFIRTSTVTDIENLQQASEILVRRQVLGIWEWREGTSRATLHEYKKPELGTTMSNRRFKFVGFAWKGALGQQPPRIEELHEDISQGADTLRWYWFKDLWLLFYFD